MSTTRAHATPCLNPRFPNRTQQSTVSPVPKNRWQLRAWLAQAVAGLLLVATSGCVTANYETTCAGHSVWPRGEGMVPSIYDGTWIPDERKLTKLEAQLGRLFAKPDARMTGATLTGELPAAAPHPLSYYNIRYVGVQSAGHRYILGQGFPAASEHAAQMLQPPEVEKEDEESVIYLTPFGGGTDYFRIKYDAESGRLLELNYNAPL